MTETRNNGGTEHTAADPSQTGPQHRAATPISLCWPFVWFWGIFRPLTFFRTQVRRQTLAAAVWNTVLNVTVTVLIIAIGIIHEEGHMSRDEWIGMAIGMPALWLVGLAFFVCLTLVLAPAMSHAATLGEAIRRAAPIVSGMTAVFPVATLLCSLMVINERDLRYEWLRPLFGRRLDEIAFGVIFCLFIFWPLLLLYLGMHSEGCGLPPADHETGNCRCEQCGYSLIVTSPDGCCPECGHAARLSTDPVRRTLPEPEDRPRRAPLYLWLATFIIAALRPATFWADKRVRTDSRGARNASLTLMALASIAAALLFFVFLGVALLACSYTGESDFAALVAISLFVFACAFIVLLLGNPTMALAAICISRLRGNPSRIDELGRLAWYSVAVPQILFCLLGATTPVLGITAALADSYHIGRRFGLSGSETEFLQVLLIIAACACGVLALGSYLWSLAVSVRAMRSTQYANF
ncbi:MAG: hypothetical protein JXL80_06460 [Planctomycetes bacterium]|nr:hypothetical protein [Planctomycetota bacterium]